MSADLDAPGVGAADASPGPSVLPRVTPSYAAAALPLAGTSRRTLTTFGGTPHSNDRMRIALVAPPWFAVPPSGYGGIERVVAYLADGLVELGHEVTLFASGGSQSKATVVSPFAEPPSQYLGEPAYEIVHTTEAYRAAASFDVVHDHTLLGLASAVVAPVPVLHTVHGPVTPIFSSLYARVSPPVGLISISASQQAALPRSAQVTRIGNAIDVASVPFSATGGDYLLFVGRMNPDKGILSAIAIAEGAQMPLLVIAKINEPPERKYFDEQVRPALARIRSEVLVQPPDDVKMQAYCNARATLFPVQWPEPFGLVMIESMASGTPVIAFDAGAVSEVIRDGQTGFVCRDVEDAIAAVARLDSIDRRVCRSDVAARFDAAVAVARHEALYRSVLAAREGRDTLASTGAV